MCGIAGIWGKDNAPVVKEMMALVAHRGPDASGLHQEQEGSGALGHQRLSIMDPEGGDQPIYTGDKSKAIVGNGEIYNFPALREELEAHVEFQTSSDMEAALHLYDTQGPGCVEDLDGMFALAISDRHKFFLARDPIGIKPLYYGFSDDAIVFASEIKALLGRADAIREFPPGTYYHSDTGFQTYYQVPEQDPVEASLATHVQRLRDTLKRSVEKRLMSDVPVGAFLSGGLDSSIITAMVRPHIEELHTFTVGFEGSPDLEAAREVANHLNTIHHEYLLDADEIRECLPQIIYHLESFDQDLVRSAVPCYFTSRLAAEHVKVILTGEGADELFAGYQYHKDIEDPTLLHEELRRSVTGLHNVNLQRVDRLTMAHALEGRVPFLDVEMVQLAQTIPPELKLRVDEHGTLCEKWILRKAVEDLLPHDIVWRVKEQFDEGTGCAENLFNIVDSNAVFLDEESEALGIRSGEELQYYNIFCEVFSDTEPVLQNMGRWTEGRVAAV